MAEPGAGVGVVRSAHEQSVAARGVEPQHSRRPRRGGLRDGFSHLRCYKLFSIGEKTFPDVFGPCESIGAIIFTFTFHLVPEISNFLCEPAVASRPGGRLEAEICLKPRVFLTRSQKRRNEEGSVCMRSVSIIKIPTNASSKDYQKTQ